MMVRIVSNLNFIEGYPREEKLQNVGWNSQVSVSGSLPNGLTFNSTTDVLSYDGSTYLQVNLPCKSLMILVQEIYKSHTPQLIQTTKKEE